MAAAVQIPTTARELAVAAEQSLERIGRALDTVPALGEPVWDAWHEARWHAYRLLGEATPWYPVAGGRPTPLKVAARIARAMRDLDAAWGLDSAGEGLPPEETPAGYCDRLLHDTEEWWRFKARELTHIRTSAPAWQTPISE